MSVIKINFDVLRIILSYISDTDRISFISSNKYFYDNICQFTFDEGKNINERTDNVVYVEADGYDQPPYISLVEKHDQKILNCKYYNQFTNIDIHNDMVDRLPTNIKKISCNDYNKLSKLNLYKIENVNIFSSIGDTTFQLPLSVKTLSIQQCDKYNYHIIPSSIVELNIQTLLCELPSDNYRHLTKLKLDSIAGSCKFIPRSVTHLEIYLADATDFEYLSELKLIELDVSIVAKTYDKIINIIPYTIQKLSIKINNYSMEDQIKINLDKLCMQTLVELDIRLPFNDYFRESILLEGTIPNNILKLSLKNFSNILISNLLSDKIQSLTLDCYNNPLFNTPLPSSLTYVDMGEKYNGPIGNLFSYGIKYLNLGNTFDVDIVKHIPLSVTHLTMHGPVLIKNKIPSSVTHLTLNGSQEYNRETDSTHCVENYYQDLAGSVPDSVTHLTFGRYFRQEIVGVIGPNVTHLVLDVHFNGRVDNNILNKVKYLTIPGKYKNILSKTRKRHTVIKYCYCFNELYTWP